MTTEIPNLAEREQYAKDLSLYESPWRKWQCQSSNPRQDETAIWINCNCAHMHFEGRLRYRRKPDTIQIAGVEVVKPLGLDVAVYNAIGGVIAEIKLHYGGNDYGTANTAVSALRALLEVESEVSG